MTPEAVAPAGITTAEILIAASVCALIAYIVVAMGIIHGARWRRAKIAASHIMRADVWPDVRVVGQRNDPVLRFYGLRIGESRRVQGLALGVMVRRGIRVPMESPDE